jgi:arginyl-tRNA synthetase
MNHIEISLKVCLQQAIVKAFAMDLSIDEINIEIPKEKSHGDYATNLAMRLSKVLKQNPRQVANQIIDNIDQTLGMIERSEIAGPGFINFFMQNEQLVKVIDLVLEQNKLYGSSDFGKGLKINIEYVSANPTGDLHPGHARGASIGDSNARIMKFAGYDVTREYYINDAGNQILNMAKSLQARYFQLFNQDVSVPEDGYHGKDLIEIARSLVDEIGDEYLNIPMEDTLHQFRAYGLKKELEKLSNDLQSFRVEFDVWSSEQSIYDKGMVQNGLALLNQAQVTYELDGAIWLKTTDFGDDKDRVLVKSDGTYTYLTPDIAYHVDKYARGYDKLINILGADHHGYIKRLKAAVQALGHQPDDLEIDIVQMARMIKDGQEYKMSKRTGKAVSLRDLIEDAGVDAVRYYFVSRAGDTHMDLDLDMASRQSNENPVYYAQYAHARMASILRSASDIQPALRYDLITNDKELELLKHINEFVNVVNDAALTRQPHKVCNYIQKIATLFHSFYSECKVMCEDLELCSQRVALVKATKITLSNALELIGVNAVERM